MLLDIPLEPIYFLKQVYTIDRALECDNLSFYYIVQTFHCESQTKLMMGPNIAVSFSQIKSELFGTLGDMGT